MLDITRKSTTLRTARARAVVRVGSRATVGAIANNTVPKGDVFGMARAAALFAVKRTADMIPDCHPMPVEHTSVHFEVLEADIVIEVEVRTVYKTGVEVEAMHGASVAALTVYDMLKPIEKDIEIRSIRLVRKEGGKSDFGADAAKDVKAAVVVVSDSVSAGRKKDTAGKAVAEKLQRLGVQAAHYEVIPDEPDAIRASVEKLCAEGFGLVVTAGGTGLSHRDRTPEALKGLLDREIPGIMEAARNYGQQRTPYAMLSRGIAGVRGTTLILTLPGSTRGAEETMDALFPACLHLFRVFEKSYRHGM